MQNNFASAGNAIETEQNPPGLYRHPQAKVEMGFLESAGADAAVRQGFVLVKPGEEAARNAGQQKAAAAPAAQAPSTAGGTN